MPDLKSMTPEELTAWCKEQGMPAFRGKQIFQWFGRGDSSVEEMTNLPKNLREALAEKYPLHNPRVVRRQESKKDGTIK